VAQAFSPTDVVPWSYRFLVPSQRMLLAHCQQEPPCFGQLSDAMCLGLVGATILTNWVCMIAHVTRLLVSEQP